MTIETQFARLQQQDHADYCTCDPKEVMQAFVLKRLGAGGCLRCKALDALHGLSKLNDRVRYGLFIDIAKAIGEPDAIMTVGDAWDDVHAALDTILDETPLHTCAGARP
jgi:hypothetical protein